MPYITPAHVARVAGLDPNTARRFIAEEIPKEHGPRTRQHFDEDRLEELVAMCRSKVKRRCRNKYNSVPLEAAQ